MFEYKKNLTETLLKNICLEIYLFQVKLQVWLQLCLVTEGFKVTPFVFSGYQLNDYDFLNNELN